MPLVQTVLDLCGRRILITVLVMGAMVFGVAFYLKYAEKKEAIGDPVKQAAIVAKEKAADAETREIASRTKRAMSNKESWEAERAAFQKALSK